MSLLSPILRGAEGGYLHFWCPGCDAAHTIRHAGDARPRWDWNGDALKPTFKPSVLVRSGHYASHHKPDERCWCTYNAEQQAKGEELGPACTVCHSFVTDGRIQFLGDCTHAMAGQTVDIPPWPRPQDAYP